MTKKKKASTSKAQDKVGLRPVDVSEQADSEASADCPAPQNTFTAASGKFFAIAQGSYPEPEDFTDDFTCDVVGAAEGDLLEVLAIHSDWAYGRRFKPCPGITLEGVFRLEWVRGMKLVLEGGKRKPVEIDMNSEEYGFKGPKSNDTAGKLQARRYKKRIEDAAELWDRLEAKAAAIGAIAEQEATAAKVAKQLEKDDAEARDRRIKEEKRREAILAEVKRRKAEAEYAKKQADAEAERVRLAEEEAKRAAKAKEVAQRRACQEAEEARCRAALEEQARRHAEEAEAKRLEQEIEAKRLEQEAEAKRLEQEAEAKRLEQESEAKRLEQEAETKRLEQEAEAKRLEQEAEEARCRAILEEQVQREAEEAEVKRLGLEAERRCIAAEIEAQAFAEGRATQKSAEHEHATTRAYAEALSSPTHQRSQGWEMILDTPSTGRDHQSASEASCGSMEESSDCLTQKRRTGLQKKSVSRKFRWPSKELEDVTGEWEKVQEEMANKSSDLDTLEEKVNSLMQSQGSGNPWQIGPPPGLELMSEAERNAAEVSALKQRVFQGLLKMKRSAGFERRTSVHLKKRVFQAMFSARHSSETKDKESEMKALQLKNLMKRAFRGMRDSRCSTDGRTTPRSSKSEDSQESPLSPLSLDSSRQGDLEMIAEQVVEQLQTKAESIKMQIRKGLLRAHRSGELLELRHELDELADSVSQMGAKLGSGSPADQTSNPSLPNQVTNMRKKRWSDYSNTESESEPNVMCRSPPQAVTDFSDSDAENKRGRRWGSATSRT